MKRSRLTACSDKPCKYYLIIIKIIKYKGTPPPQDGVRHENSVHQKKLKVPYEREKERVSEVYE